MSVAQKPKTFRELETELEDWKTDRDRLDTRIAAREALIAALKKEASLGISPLFIPDSPTNGRVTDHVRLNVVAPKDKPETGDAVFRVLLGSGQGMTKQQIYNELVERGWAPEGKNPLASVGSALWYLSAKQRRVEKIGDGRVVSWRALRNHELQSLASAAEGQEP